MKSDDASESVKLRDAVSPAFREAISELMAMVGLTVSRGWRPVMPSEA